jgi:hypothetical protein
MVKLVMGTDKKNTMTNEDGKHGVEEYFILMTYTSHLQPPIDIITSKPILRTFF